MITGELKSKVDRIWDSMWAGGIANPLTVIEQLTFLLFIKRLDELQTLRENKANRTGQPIEDPIFPEGKNPESRAGRSYADLRWSRFKDYAPEVMLEIVRDEVFPFLKTLGQKKSDEADTDLMVAEDPAEFAPQKDSGEATMMDKDAKDSTYAHHMKDAIFMFPTPRLLTSVVDSLDEIEMADRDTKGDLYEYMLGKIASAGQNGQFRTPRHIIKLMVEMTDPKPQDTICDPAAGTCGFLVAASDYLREHYENEIFADAKSRLRFNEKTFHGYDFDNTMLRIGSMNMLLHGVENPDIRYKDSLEESHAGESEAYTVVLANPPFAGSLDYESTAKDLLKTVKTKKTELLFLALFLRLLKTGGRAAVIVPDGVLFGSSKAHKEIRRILVENHKLDAVISMPSGVFKPYAGVSTAILFFTKTNSGGTDNVWFYDMKADGFSLDDRRNPLVDAAAEERIAECLTKGERVPDDLHKFSNLPDILVRWNNLENEKSRKRTEQSFLVPKADIVANSYDLSLNRYKEIVHEEIEYDSPQEIFANLARLETEIQQGMKELEGLLK